MFFSKIKKRNINVKPKVINKKYIFILSFSLIFFKSLIFINETNMMTIDSIKKKLTTDLEDQSQNKTPNNGIKLTNTINI